MVFGGVASSAAASTTVFSDDFEDGRAGWFNQAAGTGLLTNADPQVHKLNGRALSAINSAARGLTYFDSTTLGVGESLSVSFNLSFAAIGDNGGNFIVGVLNSSTGDLVTADNFGSGFDFTGYQGYRFRTNTGGTNSGSTTIEKRDPTSAAFDGSYTALTGSAAGAGLAASTAYSVAITYTRTGVSSLVATYSLNGVTLTVTDNDATNFTFDTLQYYKGGGNGTFYLDDVLITSSIPEPASAALLGGLAIGVLTIAGRRPRR